MYEGGPRGSPKWGRQLFRRFLHFFNCRHYIKGGGIIFLEQIWDPRLTHSHQIFKLIHLLHSIMDTPITSSFWRFLITYKNWRTKTCVTFFDMLWNKLEIFKFSLEIPQRRKMTVPLWWLTLLGPSYLFFSARLISFKNTPAMD